MLNITRDIAPIFQEKTEEDVKKLKNCIQRKLFNPGTVREYEVVGISKENVSGKSRQLKSIQSSVESKSSGDHFKLSQAEAMALSHIKWKLKIDEQEFVNGYPEFTYLSIRNKQNLAWVNERFTKGVVFAKQAMQRTLDTQAQLSLRNKAEICYKEGLEIIHYHPPLLCAYGALCANDGRLDMAKTLLQDAIRYGEENKSENDSINYAETVEDAKVYLKMVQNKDNLLKQQSCLKKNDNITMSIRAEKAIYDVQAERNLQMDASTTKHVTSIVGANEDYSLLSSSDASSSYHRKKERRKWGKKEDRKHRKTRSHKTQRRSRSRKRSGDDGSLSTTDNRKRHARKSKRKRKERDRITR